MISSGAVDLTKAKLVYPGMERIFTKDLKKIGEDGVPIY
jgi:hypothetical protein